MLTVRKARPDEFQAVRAFYFSLCEELADSPYLPGWEPEVYPTSEELQHALDAQELYIGLLGEEIAAGMILNSECPEGYDAVNWAIDAQGEEIMVVHLLGVHPRFSGRGLAKEMTREALRLAREAGCTTVRLDVMTNNLPAMHVYESVGFQYLETIQLYYEDTGWTDFRMYEHVL